MTTAALQRALDALANLAPRAQLAMAAKRLLGREEGPLAEFAIGSEEDPSPERLDGSLLEAICSRALDGARGAVFTPPPEARLLAAFGLAHAAARRGGPRPTDGVAALLSGQPDPALSRALDGLRVLDPSCGGGALLSAAARLARGVGAYHGLVLLGLDVAPLAVAAAALRLRLLGMEADIRRANALFGRWEPSSLLLSNPPFLRHERIPASEKARAAEKSGLSRQADLSAHLAALSLRRAPVVALVWPLALDTSRSAAPLLAEARARGAFALRLRSRAAGSFSASVDTRLAVWVAGATEDAPALEASVPLAELADTEVVTLAGGAGGARVRLLRARATPRGAVALDQLCAVRFGLKSGCNDFFHLAPLGGGRFQSSLLGVVRLCETDTVPLLSSLREARSPALAKPEWVLFRPAAAEGAAGRYLARGERASVHLRPTCAGRNPWWRLAPGRGPAPVLYPAKIRRTGLCLRERRGALRGQEVARALPQGAPGLADRCLPFLHAGEACHRGGRSPAHRLPGHRRRRLPRALCRARPPPRGRPRLRGRAPRALGRAPARPGDHRPRRRPRPPRPARARPTRRRRHGPVGPGGRGAAEGPAGTGARPAGPRRRHPQGRRGPLG